MPEPPENEASGCQDEAPVKTKPIYIQQTTTNATDRRRKMAQAKLKERSKSVPSIVSAGLCDSPNDEVDGGKVLRKQLQILVGKKPPKRRHGAHELIPPSTSRARSPSPRFPKVNYKVFNAGLPVVTLQREPCLEEELHLKVKELAISNRQLKDRVKSERDKSERTAQALKQEREEHIAMMMDVIDTNQTRAEQMNKRLKEIAKRAETLFHEKGKLERVLTDNKESHHKETQKMQARVGMLEEIIRQAKSERESMDKQITSLLGETSQLKDMKAPLENEVSDLKKSNDKLSREVTSLNDVFHHKENEISGLRTENSGLLREVLESSLTKSELETDLEKATAETNKLKQELLHCDTKNDHYNVLLDMALNRVKVLEGAKEPMSRTQSVMSHNSTRSDIENLPSIQRSFTLPHINVSACDQSPRSSPQTSVRSFEVSKLQSSSPPGRGMRAMDNLCASLSSLAGAIERETNNNEESYHNQTNLLWASSPSLLDVTGCEETQNLHTSQSTPDLLMLGEGVDLCDGMSSYDDSSFPSVETTPRGGFKSESSSWESIDILEQDTSDRSEPQIVVSPLKVNSAPASLGKKKSKLSLKNLFQGFTIDEDSPRLKRKRAPKLKDIKRSLTDIHSLDDSAVAAPSRVYNPGGTGGISSIDALQSRNRTLICAPEDYHEYMKTTKKHSYNVFKFFGGLTSDKFSKRKLSSTKRRHSKY